MLRLFSRIKKYVIIVSILLLTGCSASYNLTVNSTDDIIESLDITEADKTKFDTKQENLYNATIREYLNTDLNWPTPLYSGTEANPLEPVKIDGVKYYKKNNISTDNILGVNYSYNFGKDYGKSNIINTCFDIEYKTYNNQVFLRTGNFKCFDKYPLLDTVIFNLNTTCSVNSANSDIKGKIYTWNIKKGENKNIMFSLDCSKNKVKVSYTILLPIYFLLIGFGIIVLKLLYKLNNKI